MPTSPFETLIALLLLIWLVVSILNQFDFKWMEFIRAHDFLGVLGQWRFFPRDSGQWDYHLFYREKDTDGKLSDWNEISVTEVRAPYHCFWNPEKRNVKILTDLASSVVGSAIECADKAQKSLPYLLLLNIVRHHGVIRTPVERQFMIARGLGGHPAPKLDVLFRSVFHRIP
jgi:hypothetical protein